MVLNTGNFKGNSNGGKLHHGAILQKYTNFKNETAKINVEALMQNYLARILPVIW